MRPARSGSMRSASRAARCSGHRSTWWVELGGADDRLASASRRVRSSGHHRDRVVVTPIVDGVPRRTLAIRTAREDDTRAAVLSLSRAFWSDPLIVHFYPDRAVRSRRIRANLPLGHVDVSDGCEAVALWRPPRRWRVRRRTKLVHRPRMAAAYGSAAGRVLACHRALARHQPAGPHWYLMTFGTDPDRQGCGLAGALLRSRFDRCDAEGAPAYLEAATSGHLPFYGGFGFQPQGGGGASRVPGASTRCGAIQPKRLRRPGAAARTRPR